MLDLLCIFFYKIQTETLPIRHLFERYYKITELHLGLGIGLAFVKSLTMLHKGDIYVYSERHKGTEIIISLPASRSDYSMEEQWIRNAEIPVYIESIDHTYDQQSSSLPESSVQTNTSKVTAVKQILIVDDNKELRAFLKDSLQAHYQITEAPDGQAGLEAAKEMHPDLIISDVMMPVMDGIEFCRNVKEDMETSHISFIMLTARQALASTIEGVGSGADFYFSKPLSIELLLLTIRNIFEQRQKLKDRYLKDVHVYFTRGKLVNHRYQKIGI
jgi:CheY-like chemotaxis protein